MFERFHEDARQTVVLAQEEALLFDHDHIGTEHLLLALLRQPGTVPATVLARHGLEHDDVGDRIGRLVAAAAPDDLDASALESIGIDLDAIREKVEATFGPGALDREPRSRRDRPWRVGGRLPFTRRAKKVLELSLRESLALGHNYICGGHILLGLLREGEGLAAKVIADAGVDFDTLRQEIRAELG
ncbi:Clp protease N-terminal domain-containing protein [Sphaerisporangium corydalis]|uniref:Clp protease N-terminal domain-containing protein n=1 Tax=Sphaerisporangium corydalis TaxID=1441875 RepID=A0ABV9ECY7_9ACTN|nr:Clp protease N-terminal domain-containing protein [Sphaerisporangium corydalis]